MQGRSVAEYRAPLFIAWQLTNRCSARCIACCEDSGPDKAWRDEMSRAEALDLARRIAAFGIPYAAFGGGEPLAVPHCWEIFEHLTAAGVSLPRASASRAWATVSVIRSPMTTTRAILVITSLSVSGGDASGPRPPYRPQDFLR